MDGLSCKEPHFQWDDETNSCLGCIEDGIVREVCKSCDDYKVNAEKENLDFKWLKRSKQ